MKPRYLDNGFYRISRAFAEEISGLSRPGYERLVTWRGIHVWVSLTTVEGRGVWSMRAAWSEDFDALRDAVAAL